MAAGEKASDRNLSVCPVLLAPEAARPNRKSIGDTDGGCERMRDKKIGDEEQ